MDRADANATAEELGAQIAVLKALKGHKSLDARQLSALSGVDPAPLRAALDALAAEGLVAAAEVGGVTRYSRAEPRRGREGRP